MWQPGKILLAFAGQPQEVDGFINGAGLGIHRVIMPQGERWTLTHLNSGHSLCYVYGTQQFTLEMVNEIAALADWTFTDVLQFVREHKEVFKSVECIIDKYAPFVSKHDGLPAGGDLDMAKRVARERGAI